MANICKKSASQIGDSSSIEDYLEAIIVLDREGGGPVRVTDLSERLGVSKPSVSAAVRRLAEIGWVMHERYGGVELTPQGRTRAAEIAARHDLLHRFLTLVLGVDEATAQEDACRLEHVLSDDTIRRLGLFVEFLVGGHADSQGPAMEFAEHMAAGRHHSDLLPGGET